MAYQEIDISTGLPIPLEAIIIDANDMIRAYAYEMLRYLDHPSVNEEERTEALSGLNSRILFHLRRIKLHTEIEKSNAANHSSQTNP